MTNDENNRYRFEESNEEIKNDNESINDNKKENIKVEENEKQNKDKKHQNGKHQDDKCHEKINALNKEIEELKNELEQAKKDVLLARADEINFKKRVEADKNQMVEYANQKVFEKLITQLDMFDKVVSMETKDEALKNYLIGFQMINNNLKQVLEEEGVKKISVKVGDKLDPKYHHALQTAWDENYEEDIILQELQTGYLYKGRILRPTLVKVNKKIKEEGK